MITNIADPSHVGEARRLATEFARKAGGNETQLSRVALVATEMATNIIKHTAGVGGALIVERIYDADGSGIELVAIDKGPGMVDVNASLVDGHSTAGSPGTGLGAIARQADRFAVYSRPGLGTAVAARVFFGPSTTASGKPDIGVISTPYPGETENGDGWSYRGAGRRHTLLVVDGSGHGASAARAAEAAIRIFSEFGDEDCAALVERMHRGLASTRGAALAVARIDGSEGVVRYVGVGNIIGSVANGADTRQMVSHNGTAGHVAPRIREFTYSCSGTPSIIMHSDGLSNRWRLADYPGLAVCHPALIAGVLFRDFRRGRDDATVAVMRPR